jgi:hypothetical protein
MNWVQIASMAIGIFLGVTIVKGVFPSAQRFGLKVRFWLRYGRKGKTILFVYSDSSNWKDYIETNILPHIEAHSTILNWSKRREWGSRMQLETKLFNQWAGPGEFVPVAILFSFAGQEPSDYGNSPRILNTEKPGYPRKPRRPSLKP